MLTSQMILDKLTAYLNHDITLAQLVDWAETRLIEPDFSDDEDVDRLMDILTYLGASDSRGFPLTWEMLTHFLHDLGGEVEVTIKSAY